MNTDLNYKDWLISLHEDYRKERQLRRNKRHNKQMLIIQYLLIINIVFVTNLFDKWQFNEGILPIIGISIYLMYSAQKNKR